MASNEKYAVELGPLKIKDAEDGCVTLIGLAFVIGMLCSGVAEVVHEIFAG